MDAIKCTEMWHREFLTFEYALINPMRLDSEQWADLPVVPLHAKGFVVQSKMLPHVISLGGLSREQRIDVLARNDSWQRVAREPLFCALLRSDAVLETLVNHFSARMVMKAPGRQKVWLRFHDPSVFTRLGWLLTDAQMRHLFGPVDAWTWFDPWAGQWRTRQRPGRGEAGAATVLDGKQWAALYRQPLLQRCLKQMARNEGVPTAYQALAARLDTTLQHALILGLKDRDDACLYALSIERHGPEWSKHFHVREAIQKARQGEQSLVRSLSDMDETYSLPRHT